MSAAANRKSIDHASRSTGMTDLKKLPVKQIALDKLVLSAERNVRRMVEEPIDALAAAIAACGLLQNLVVHPQEKGVFGVCAGGGGWPRSSTTATPG
jgi:hypothetical protein